MTGPQVKTTRRAGTNDDAVRLRAWWSHKQGLDGRLAGAPAATVLEQTGWARSVGGVGPYLTLFSRAGLSRADADAAVARAGTFVRDELGDARAFSLDSPKSRAPKIAALRKAANHELPPLRP